ncbi:hypothetical protein HYPSUDRAFT_51300 [Hypholoma sublateritium FD-334 SS-4]|uniref:PEHE domain-containing protein n=1 Tax=Hypholoma sublateritium (strain FD-334 SS-4) TaxID=945553 RepID=A0A0D2PJ99_HYPSF|nr:hypothetical protein HYPSUDRAFT_51300 [Hypholoma sublateritium FD-334 SS-4]
MDPPASSTASGQGRRQNPSRSKRGGPGVGTCDVDVIILESYKRKLETEPLIPEDTIFVLTTNSSKFSGKSSASSESAISINTVANDRYFDRPEVLKAFREQEIIQTPEFWPIPDSSSVGGRFRPRGAEDESAETSDAAYEKRHKKFETFEKRQRLREKEKLKHEHYKLKERIDQLRATDSSAFMTPTASGFLAVPQQEELNTDTENADTAGIAQAHTTFEQIEGERRKREMLDHAISLEKRYSYLLPSDRARKTQDVSIVDKAPGDDESETERIAHAGPSRKDPESIKFRLPARTSLSATPASSPAATKPPKKPKGWNLIEYRKARAAQRSISTSLPPQDQTSSISSPIVDVEMETPEAEGASLSPPAIVAAPEIPVTSSRGISTKFPASTRQTNGKKRAQNDSHVPQTDSAELEDQPTAKVSKRIIRARPTKIQIADDGESEKVSSEEEDNHADELEAPEEDVKVNEQDNARMLESNALSPEAREHATRMQQISSTTLSPSNGHKELHTVFYTEHPSSEAALVSSPGPEESISVRPNKRQRKASLKARAQSIAQSTTYSQTQHTPSVPPSPQAVPLTLSGRPYRKPGKSGPRGQQSQVYISSTTGEEVRTTSFLMMAAIRSEGAKRNVEKRHNTSFGIPTPSFRDHQYDFEIPEWMHYPDDEEPVIPLPDNYAELELQTQLADTTEHDVEESAQHVEDLEPQVDNEGPVIAATSDGLEPEEPVRQATPQLEIPQAVADKNGDQARDEPMETENEPEQPGSSPPPEPESVPGVGIRVLSRSRDDEDEELEW